jgi:hypothetical protein
MPGIIGGMMGIMGRLRRSAALSAGASVNRRRSPFRTPFVLRLRSSSLLNYK